MKNILLWLTLIVLSTGLLSCLDHRGFGPENAQRVRIKSRTTIYGQPTSPLSTTGVVQFAYDASGRLLTVTVGGRQPYATADYQSYITTLNYDVRGKLSQEQYVDAPGNPPLYKATYTYQYDAQDRISTISSNNRVVWAFTYDAQNRVSNYVFYAYGSGEGLFFTSYHSNDFDANNNVVISLQRLIYEPSRGLSFRRRTVYSYDQNPNPLLRLPTLVTNGFDTANSPNNPTSSVTTETNSLDGPFEPVYYTENRTYINEYKNGQLVKTIIQALNPSTTLYEYETY